MSIEHGSSSLIAPEGPPVPETEAGKSESAPETAAPSKIERVFGKEVVHPEDIKAMSREVSHLLQEQDQPDSLFQAARQLAHLKRAGIGVTDPTKRENMSTLLLGNLDAMRQKSPLEHAKYLGYLKYIGVLQEVADQDKDRLEFSAISSTHDHQPRELAEFFMWQKYLKIRPEVSTEHQRLLQEDLKSGVAHNRSAAALLLAQGRMKYLGIPTGLSAVEQEKADAAVSQKVGDAAAQGQWHIFARLQNIVDYAYGEVTVQRADQEKVTAHFAAARNEAQRHGRWGKFTAFFADSAGLSRRAEKLGPLLEDEVPQVLDGATSERTTSNEWTDVSSGSVLDAEPRPASTTDTTVDRASDTVVIETPAPAPEVPEEVSPDVAPAPPQSESPLTLAEMWGKEYPVLKEKEQHYLAQREAPPIDDADRQAKELMDALYLHDEDLPKDTWGTIEKSVLAEVAHGDARTRTLVARYMTLRSNEISYSVAQEGSFLDNLTSGNTQHLLARSRVGGAFGIFTMFSRRAGDTLRQARQATAEAMHQAAVRTEHEPTTRALLRRLANEFELINLREIMLRRSVIASYRGSTTP